MKKLMLAALLMLLLAGCGSAGAGTNQENNGSNPPSVTPAETDSPSNPVNEEPPEPSDKAGAATEQEAADAVIAALKAKDMETLSTYVHPVKGLLFSPYAHIEQNTALVFQANELPDLTDATVRNWGVYDGSGEPIELTFSQYYDKFVYDKDFISAETVGLDEIKGQGNTLVNIKEVFPDSFVVDYYFSGFDPQYDGMDWESLILVLEQHEGAWYVSAVVHSQWTI